MKIGFAIFFCLFVHLCLVFLSRVRCYVMYDVNATSSVVLLSGYQWDALKNLSVAVRKARSNNPLMWDFLPSKINWELFDDNQKKAVTC